MMLGLETSEVVSHGRPRVRKRHGPDDGPCGRRSALRTAAPAPLANRDFDRRRVDALAPIAALPSVPRPGRQTREAAMWTRPFGPSAAARWGGRVTATDVSSWPWSARRRTMARPARESLLRTPDVPWGTTLMDSLRGSSEHGHWTYRAGTTHGTSVVDPGGQQHSPWSATRTGSRWAMTKPQSSRSHAGGSSGCVGSSGSAPPSLGRRLRPG